jgi:hypothetical protein
LDLQKEMALSDEMESALGRFITELGEVENVMFEAILAVADEEPNDVHKKFYSGTFAPKIEMLEEYTKHNAFNEHRQGIDHLLGMLKDMLPQRNNLIHGETYYLTSRTSLAPWLTASSAELDGFVPPWAPELAGAPLQSPS